MCSSWQQHPGKQLLYNTITCSHHCALQPLGQGEMPRVQGSTAQPPLIPTATLLYPRHSILYSQTHRPVLPGTGGLRRSGMQPGGCRASLGKEHMLGSRTTSALPH